MPLWRDSDELNRAHRINIGAALHHASAADQMGGTPARQESAGDAAGEATRTPAGDRERMLARLAVLQRLKEEVAGKNRPAMFHSVLQLMKLESAALWRLERAAAANDESP